MAQPHRDTKKDARGKGPAQAAAPPKGADGKHAEASVKRGGGGTRQATAADLLASSAAKYVEEMRGERDALREKIRELKEQVRNPVTGVAVSAAGVAMAPAATLAESVGAAMVQRLTESSESDDEDAVPSAPLIVPPGGETGPPGQGGVAGPKKVGLLTNWERMISRFLGRTYRSHTVTQFGVNELDQWERQDVVEQISHNVPTLVHTTEFVRDRAHWMLPHLNWAKYCTMHWVTSGAAIALAPRGKRWDTWQGSIWNLVRMALAYKALCFGQQYFANRLLRVAETKVTIASDAQPKYWQGDMRTTTEQLVELKTEDPLIANVLIERRTYYMFNTGWATFLPVNRLLHYFDRSVPVCRIDVSLELCAELLSSRIAVSDRDIAKKRLVAMVSRMQSIGLNRFTPLTEDPENGSLRLNSVVVAYLINLSNQEANIDLGFLRAPASPSE